jgi:hypothetical protein
LIDFQSRIYIAAKNFKEFEKYKKEVLKINKKLDVGWWPIFEKSYWISPFSYTFELKKLIGELEKRSRKEKLRLMVDLELPFLNRKLFLINLFKFFRNKRLIKRIFKNQNEFNLEILTSEYPFGNSIIRFLMGFLGVSYSTERYGHKIISMYYTSMLKEFFKKSIRGFISGFKNKKNLVIGLGTIAVGVFGNEPILSDEKLKEDLNFCKENKIDNVVIFRLGGLNDNYLKVVKGFVNRV